VIRLCELSVNWNFARSNLIANSQAHKVPATAVPSAKSTKEIKEEEKLSCNFSISIPRAMTP